MFHIMKEDGRKGFGYVRDYLGNIWYYGPIKDCQKFMEGINKAGKRKCEGCVDDCPTSGNFVCPNGKL